MPALWPQFIANVTANISGRNFDNASLPGAIPPRENINVSNPNFAVTQDSFGLPSGRRGFGRMIAEEYISAIKTAQTPFGATHFTNAAADEALKIAYAEVFERIYREGDLDLIDTKDAAGNILKMGKESHPAFEDLCPDPIEPPDPIEEQKKEKIKLDKFIEKYENDSNMNLSSFINYEFHCIEDGQPQWEVEILFANRLLRQFQKITGTVAKLRFFNWVESLGKKIYKDTDNSYYYSSFRYKAVGVYPYFNVPNSARTSITNAGYEWKSFVDSVSNIILEAIYAAYPPYTVVTNAGSTTVITDIESRFNRYGDVSDLKLNVPWPYNPTERPECPLSVKKIQIARDVETEPTRPKLLTKSVITLFSYDDTAISSEYAFYNVYRPLSTKTPTYIKSKYEELELKNKWFKIPNITSSSDLNDLKAKMPYGGTLYKFTIQSAIDAKEAADECDDAEEGVEIDFDYQGGDPYDELALATITYWYSHIVQPFNKMPATLPALIDLPLTGIYVPIYYGSVRRLGKDLRRSLNTGKSFDKLPATQPPAAAIATALAASYAKHLLEFKLIYLGGIPVPLVPFVPMVGFVPLVF